MPLTLLQYNKLLRSRLAMHPELQAQWVVAELIDVRIGTHAYMDLIEKDASGATVARMRATIWRTQLAGVLNKFRMATGKLPSNGMKVLVRGSAGFHESYGLSFNIIDIDPSYTLGDMERVRREILEALRKEGLLTLNKKLELPPVVQRIAVVSAAGAAGYGDFMNQLTNNSAGVVFYPVLFEALMQGERTAASVIDALQRIEMSVDVWDCVVIIRGGGATTDLEGFDNLALARTVAMYTLPVIVGIGHERDRTVLDEIAHTRVKTPTAAAEFIVGRATTYWSRIEELLHSVVMMSQEAIAGSREQLSQLETRLHTNAQARIAQARLLLQDIASKIPAYAGNRIDEGLHKLELLARAVSTASELSIGRERQRLDYTSAIMKQRAEMKIREASERLGRLSDMARVLSPQHTLERGYSLTSFQGKAVRNPSSLPVGAEIITTLAEGRIASKFVGMTKK